MKNTHHSKQITALRFKDDILKLADENMSIRKITDLINIRIKQSGRQDFSILSKNIIHKIIQGTYF